MNFTEKRAHSTILIQAGADTTGTALGCTIRYLLTNPGVLQKARAELDAADAAGKLSNPISYEESRVNLPYFGACIKESLRLNPPAPNLFGRVVPKGGKRIGKEHIPAGVDITSNAYVMQRDPALYGLDAEVYRPERWLESPHANEMDSSMFVFGMGPRVCIGKDVAMLELSKLLPEVGLHSHSIIVITTSTRIYGPFNRRTMTHGFGRLFGTSNSISSTLGDM